MARTIPGGSAASGGRGSRLRVHGRPWQVFCRLLAHCWFASRPGPIWPARRRPFKASIRFGFRSRSLRWHRCCPTSGLGGKPMRRLLLVAVACAVVGSSPLESRGQMGPPDELESLRTELRALRERVEGLESGLVAALQALHAYALPDTMQFASEPVPLDRWDVRERLER